MTTHALDQSAEDVAARLLADADTHEQQAEQTPDRFQAAAYRGVAEDLRARAAAVLSETEAGRRLARQQAELADHRAEVQAAHAAALERYKTLADAVAGLIDDAETEALALARRMHAAAAEFTAAALDAEATARTAADAGVPVAPPPNYVESVLRELMAEAPGRARVWNGARNSVSAVAQNLAGRVNELAQQQQRALTQPRTAARHGAR